MEDTGRSPPRWIVDPRLRGDDENGCGDDMWPKTGGGFPLLCNGRSPPSRRRQSGLDCRATLRSARNDAGWILSPLTGLQNDILSVHNKFLRFSCAIPNH